MSRATTIFAVAACAVMLAVAAWLYLSALETLESVPQPQQGQHSGQPADNKGGTTAPASQSQRGANANERTQQNDNRIPFRDFAGWTLAALGLWISWLIYGVYDNQRIIMATQATIQGGQLKATQDAAKAAIIQAKASIVAQSASVGVKQPESRIEKTADGKLHRLVFLVRLQNSGPTPTQSMFSEIGLTVVAFPNNFIYPTANLGQHPMVIGAKSELVTGDVSIAGDYAERVIAGTEHLFVFGCAEYDDIFDDTPRHRVEYCFEVKVRALADGSYLTDFLLYGPHNRHFDIEKPRPAATGNA